MRLVLAFILAMGAGFIFASQVEPPITWDDYLAFLSILGAWIGIDYLVKSDKRKHK